LQQRRDVRRLQQDTGEALKHSSSNSDPARQAEAKELLERTWQSMDTNLRAIASRRLDGESWTQVAAALGGTADARRKQFERGLYEIAERLGVDEANEHA
jgi:hypothetical protein